MRIGIVTTKVPFIYGGAEFLADNLKDKLIENGHEAEVISIPFKWYPPERILDHIMACRLLKIENVDRVIALKFPAYYVKHDNKVLWLLHQFRQVYELWGTEYQDLPSNPEGNAIRNIIINSDNQFLPEAKKIFTNSKIVGERLLKYNNIQSSILFPPLMNPNQFFCREYGDYFLFPSRINRIKRQYLAAQAMNYTKSPVKLIIVGKSESSDEFLQIINNIHNNGFEKKVEIIDRFISEEEKVKLFSSCLGCIYIPYGEDSYGYVSLESYFAKKPVITCTDSGDTTVLVKDNYSGFVVSPDPKEIAKAMDTLYYDKKKARNMGERGMNIIQDLNISWDYIIKRLTE